MKKVIFALVLALPGFAMAANFNIEYKAEQFNVVQISASKVKGVSIRVAQEITRKDCNRRSINFTLTAVEGNKDVAWNQTAYVSAGTVMTEMHCPLPKPVTEIIYSQEVNLKSLINEHANGLIDLTLIVPAGYIVVASEVSK